MQKEKKNWTWWPAEFGKHRIRSPSRPTLCVPVLKALARPTAETMTTLHSNTDSDPRDSFEPQWFQRALPTLLAPLSLACAQQVSCAGPPLSRASSPDSPVCLGRSIKWLRRPSCGSTQGTLCVLFGPKHTCWYSQRRRVHLCLGLQCPLCVSSLFARTHTSEHAWQAEVNLQSLPQLLPTLLLDIWPLTFP